MAAVTTLALVLVGEFGKDLRRALTIRQLAKHANKPYANVHAAVQRLLKDNILQKETIGHSHLCKLNLENPLTGIYLSLWQAQKSPEIPKRLLELERDPNVLTVWKREEDILVVTKAQISQEFSGEVWTAWNELDDKTKATLGKHALLLGHGAYVDLVGRYGK